MSNNKQKNLAIAKNTTLKLLSYCENNHWAGYDPYDALNSRIFRALPFLNFKIFRLFLTQGVKRFPINLRPLLLVPKTSNPKGIALFLSSICNLSKIGLIEEKNMMNVMAEKLLALRSPENPYFCWGYNFDWQSRKRLIPQNSPNIICTTFAANALLDAYEQSEESLWLDAAISAADFITDVLLCRESPTYACFSYTPLGQTEIHNANLLGASLLCRISQVSGRRDFLVPALDGARFSVSKQHKDGSWPYGEKSTQQWVDNFHTGYNLVALRRICEYAETEEFEPSINLGFQFFKDHFFCEDGAPRYYHDETYPIDIHSIAQSIITLLEFRDMGDGNTELAYSVLNWAVENMWDTRGFFYFQKRPHHTIHTSFMRWSQAWMLFALSTYLEKEN
ncbi:hypothetical protein ACFLRW_05055 [Acidobacteriota bacterium]